MLYVVIARTVLKNQQNEKIKFCSSWRVTFQAIFWCNKKIRFHFKEEFIFGWQL